MPSYQINDKLFLNRANVSKADAVKAQDVEVPTNILLVFDCSGSMSWTIPQIREQVKKKVPKLMKDGDTLSITWFSGRGEFGTLLEAEPIASVKDLATVNAAIDRWLKPVGLTGFVDPLNEVAALIQRIGAKRPGTAFSLFFLTDGCDNSSGGKDQILKALDKAAPGLSAATFVEYGYYADRPLLTAMAERSGGSLILANDLDKYEAAITATISKRPQGTGKRVELQLPKVDVIGGFAFALQGADLLTFGIDGNKVSVPEGLEGVYFLSTEATESIEQNIVDISKAESSKVAPYTKPLAAIYGAISLFAVRMKSDVVRPLLRATGDVAFINQFANCFGKQKYTDFVEATKTATFDVTKRFTDGWDPSRVPRDDAFTALDMLQLLAEDDENRVLLEHDAWSYSRVSRGTVDSNTVLTDDEQAEIAMLTESMTKTKDPKEVAKFSARIAEISNKPEALKFEATPNPDGFSISNLVFNEDRPNVSIQVRKEGTVDLSSRKDRPAKVPEKFPSFIFRNYTIIQVDVMPCKLSQETAAKLAKLHKEGRIPDGIFQIKGSFKNGALEMSEVLINLAKMPIVNANMMKTLSAKTLFEQEYKLTQQRARTKVIKSYKDAIAGKRKSEGFKDTYGETEADWLKEQGLTDYSGFNPKKVQAPSVDVYTGKALTLKIAGYSSLPSVKDVQKRMAEIKAGKGKLTASMAVMEPAVNDLDALVDSKPADLATSLEEKAKANVKATRDLIANMAKTKFAIVVGQTWFSEFKSLDENTMTIDVDGNKLDCTVEMSEIEVKI